MKQRIAADHRDHLREYWLNVRRIRFWILVLLLVYTIAGFLGLPWLLRTYAIETLKTDHDRELRIAEVRINPYALTLRIDGLELDDRDGEPMVRFDRLLVDFTLLSLYNRAWTFETVDLDGLAIRAERFDTGETRLERLAGEFARPAPGEPDEPPTEEAEDGLPRLVIQQLRLDDGRLRFVDHLPPETVELTLDPVNIEVNRIDTRPGREGDQSVRMELDSGGTLDWQGTLQMVPFRAEGRVQLREVVADGLLPYLQETTPLTNLQLTFDTAFAYRASLSDDGPGLEIDDLQAEFRDLAVSAFEPETEFLAADAIRVESLAYRHHDRRMGIDAVRVEAPRVRTWLTPAGEPGLLALLPGNDRDGTAGDTVQPGKPLSLELARLEMGGLDVDLADRSTTPPAPIGLRDVDVELREFNLEQGTSFPTRITGALATGGRVAFNGSTRILPGFGLKGDLRVDRLGLVLAQPYLERVARARLADGSVSLDGRLAIRPDIEPLAYDGSVRVDGLDIVTAAGDEPVIGWSGLRIDRLQIGLGANRVQTSLVSIDQPFVDIAIAEDKSTNIGRLLIDRDDGAAAQSADADSAPSPDLAIDGISVSGGAMNFSDRSLPLPFSTRVEALDGRVSTLASGSSEPAELGLEGQVGEYGLARIDGTIDTWQPVRHTNIGLEFRNLEMPDYSPYTVQFAGRRIASGRMDLDLAYAIDEGDLQGSNDIILRDLELGERVDNPDAANLPLGLAVALLKDSNGVIDIELPVSGDVNDPEFAIGGIVRQALVALIARIVTSPFSLLGSLVGFESEDFGRIEFLAGRSDLTPPQREKVDKLAEALGKRPQLAVQLAGTWDARIDRPVLQRAEALAAVRAMLEEDEVDTGNLSLADEAARGPLRDLFREAYPETDLDTVVAQFTAPPADDPEAEPVLDAVAYYAHLARRVAAAREVTRAELEAVATARAESIRSTLLGGADGDSADDGLRPQRVRVAEPRAVEAGDGERVAVEIELATD